jgi:hypothetical protein
MPLLRKWAVFEALRDSFFHNGLGWKYEETCDLPLAG